jgi:hypothetical protein
VTAQLVLINQLAIAVATDTLTSWESAGVVKTFPSASKVYELPAPATGVVLHSGRVAIGRTSWRLLVREWTRSSNNLSAPTMADYRDSFTKWVNEHASAMGLDDTYGVSERLGPHEHEGGHIGWLAVELGDSMRTAILDDPKKADSEASEAIHSIIKKSYSTDAFDDLSQAAAKALITKAKVDLGENFRVALQIPEGFHFSQKISAALSDFATAALRHIPTWETSSTDLHFVGYGVRQSLGNIAKLGIFGYWGGALRISTTNLGAESPWEYPIICPIAQSSAIDAFWTGISDGLADAIFDAVNNALKQINGASNEDVEKALGLVGDQINVYREEKFTSPMFQAIGTLAISNLGKFAEFLIHLQAFRSATDESEATVGGFVESLVITPEHGVRWRHRLSADVRDIEESSHPFD